MTLHSTPAHFAAGPALERTSTISSNEVYTASLRSWAELSLPRPDSVSGLFPAFDPRPPPLARSGRRLRRAVLLTVVLGTVTLLAYVSWQWVSWQRVAHARTVTPVSSSLHSSAR